MMFDAKKVKDDIVRFIRDYYQQVHANKLDKLEEMNKFLKILQPSRTES